MSRCEDVQVGDDRSATHGGFTITEAYERDPNLPGILVHFSPSSSDDLLALALFREVLMKKKHCEVLVSCSDWVD